MTQREYTLQDGTQSYILTADKGKDIVRKSDGFNFGNEIWLGYRFTKNGHVLEKPEDFTEIDHVEEDFELA